MKLQIVGDWHIGAGLNLGKTNPETQINTRLMDFSNTFNSIVDSACENGVEVLVLTGDVFETRQPTPVQINECVKCIRRAIDKGLKIFIAAGNHDQQRSGNITTIDFLGYIGLENLKVAQTITSFQVGQVNLILLPYHDRKSLGVESNSDAANLIKEKISSVKKDGMYNLIVGHFMMENTAEADNPEGYSISEILLPVKIFEGIDAVVMGHVHRPDVLSKENPIIIYSGSMDRVSIGEKSHNKSTVLIDTKKNKFKLIPTKVRSMYDLDFNLSDDPNDFGPQINMMIFDKISEFGLENNLQDSIVRINIRVKESDAVHLNQNKIKEHLVSLGVHSIYAIQVYSFKPKQVRDSKINETTDQKKAMLSYLDNINESDTIKARLKKEALNIIDGGK